MGNSNSLRCCLACVLPCGALDLIRIVHIDGYVQEITHPTTAANILLANPGHVLSKPSSQGVLRKIHILSPDSDLKRGGIYFLIPVPGDHKYKQITRGDHLLIKPPSSSGSGGCGKINKTATQILEEQISEEYCDRYLAQVISVKKSSRRDRRRRHRRSHGSRVVEWRPRLESIAED